MKYIDADKLIAEIERRVEEYNIQSLRGAELSDLLSFITFLQQEQPELPANLNEAASKYESNLSADYYQDCGYADNDVIDAFKAGAEWMAGQGVTCDGRIMKSSTGETYAESDYVPLDGKCGDKVIVQIREKDSSE